MADALDDRQRAHLAEPRDDVAPDHEPLEAVEVAGELVLVLGEGDERDRGVADPRVGGELAQIRDELPAPLFAVARIDGAPGRALARDLELEPERVLGAARRAPRARRTKSQRGRALRFRAVADG